MSTISTHVLDTVLGKPTAGVQVRLERKDGDDWTLLAASQTDADGRCRELFSHAAEGVYRLIFSTGEYLAAQGRASVFVEVPIHFHCDGHAHYHLPLLLSDHSYTTYRGS
ncbi:MAG TPA: hydroxyisourate hydrolase [Terracidiphilus sp.]|jgi:5-hydroxyisourate hydrolase|nr:hydroxyisourate hydrolase [Terracidiphilus sp.]